MVPSQETVELPANPQVKQLAHDVAREENEYCVPVLLEIYEYLSVFEEERATPIDELEVDIENSLLSKHAVEVLVETLKSRGVLDLEELGDMRDGYVLAREE